MPASSKPVPVGVADDVWHLHEAQIKDLYQNQRKTLREVKRLMEENGFPKTPLSTWESKLRERLHLRKKTKSHNWPLIYRHIRPRLEHPKKKQLKEKTIICLNGSEIPWTKAWKEIRRSGALTIDSRSTPPSPLPPEVTIRSPSPGSFTPAPSPRSARPLVSDLSTSADRTTAVAVVPFQTSVVAPISQARSLTYSLSVYLLQWCASTIPWLEVCQSIQHMFREGKHTQQLEMSFSLVLSEFLATSAISRAARSQLRNQIISSESRMDFLRDNRPIPPRPSPDLGYRVAKSRGQIQLGQFIATAVFLLSNRLHDPNDGDQGLELLCSLLDRDASLTTILLQRRVPSIRATWESLFEFAMRKRRRDTFRVLADIGIHNHWFKPSNPGYCLFCAVEMNCYSIVTKVVAYCCGSKYSHWWLNTWSFKAIMEAIRKGNVECASFLIQHCDVNATRDGCCSMFQNLVANLDGSNDEYALALELFLANGADVDKNTERKNITRRWRELVGRNEFLDTTRPTLLDEVFYMNRSMFNNLRPYSRVPTSKITRTGLLVALENGSQALRDYLSARQFGIPSFHSWHVESLLELLLAEQFKMPRKVDMRIVQGLLEFGVDYAMPSVALDIWDFWRKDEEDIMWSVALLDCSRGIQRAEHLDFTWHHYASVNERMGLLNMLLTQSCVIGELVLEGIAAQHGAGGLECLVPYLPDFPTKAVRALARAARLNDFQAVEFLLRKGVDPNACIIANGQRYSIPTIAIQASFFREPHHLPDGGCSLEMIQFLVKHGARLVVNPKDSTRFEFAKHLLRESNFTDLLAKVKYVLSALMKENNPPHGVPSSLLEICIARGPFITEEDGSEKRLEMFEYLFRQGAEVSPGSPLAALIYEGAREELARDVLYSGSDLNAYWVHPNGGSYTPLQMAASRGNENLVDLFLREGANVNTPACGQYGFTALQGICLWGPATEEEHQRKIRICRLLINQGADLSSAPAERTSTALGEAAKMGDLELATLFLREGAYINATGDSRTPLDEAARMGRLDMVKFLLNANALSCIRGATGYDGAISKAEERDHSAVADVIRGYAAKVETGTVFNPELLNPQDEGRVHGFGTDDASSDAAEDVVGVAGGISRPANTESGCREVAQTIQGEHSQAT